MRKHLEVLKLSATGNTFVFLDLRREGNAWASSRLPALSKKLSAEFASDGLLAVRSGRQTGEIRLDFLNPDGSEAFCGNGTRAAGFYEVRFRQGRAKGGVKIRTLDGMREVRVEEFQSRLLKVPMPSIGQARKLNVVSLPVYRAQAGCPHAVLFVSDAETVKVDEVGKKVRWHPALAPAGANVDFVQVLSKTRLKIRTYERGVERETGSCGSGALASAALARHLGKISGSVCDLDTRGGNLRVYFPSNGNAPYLALEGTVEVLFEGKAYVR